MEHSRPAVAGDLARLLELSAVARAELRAERGGSLWAGREAPPEPRDAELRAAIDDPEALVQVGCIDGYPVGFGLVRRERLRSGERLAVIGDLFVERPFREVAVGEAIMDALIEWARRNECAGIDGLVLPGMRESKNFFERYGMKARALVVHRVLIGDGADDSGEADGDGAATADEARGWWAR